MVNQTATHEKVNGVVDRIVWRNDSGDVIAKIRCDDGKMITVIGNMLDPYEGTRYEFEGKKDFNRRFGCVEVRFKSYRTIVPDDNQGIRHYLVRHAKGVGPKIAKKLVDLFGEDTIRILKEDPDRVVIENIPGLTKEKVYETNKTLIDNQLHETATLEVGSLIGDVLGSKAVELAIKKWGSNAAAIIKRDVYRLTQLRGVGFVKADQLYLKQGGNRDSLKRHLYAAVHVLNEIANRDGHTIVQRIKFDAEIRSLVKNPHPKLFEFARRADRAHIRGGGMTHADLYHCESEIADRLIEMMSVAKWEWQPCKKDLERCESLSDEQRGAMKLVMENHVSILAGAPGTGKTYTLAKIISAFRSKGMGCKVCAPTGKAAKQAQLAMAANGVQMGAQTIHGLLEPSSSENGFVFTRHAGNPIEAHVVIVDETSMVDVRLMRSLLDAVLPATRVIFVGDQHQLPSVGPGAVLRDMIEAGVPFAELKQVRRNSGLIVEACHKIKDGAVPSPAPKLNLEALDNWRHIEAPDSQVLPFIEKIISGFKGRFNMDPVWQCQIISPTNEIGQLSCKVLNTNIRSIINANPYVGKLPFGVDDKVVQKRNMSVRYSEDDPRFPNEARIVNGDIGFIKDIDRDWIRVAFLHPDRLVKIRRKDHYLQLAYCLTCHKMQGSEIEAVIMPVTDSMTKMRMMTREWFYTAISRPKKFLITVGSLRELPRVLRRVGNNQRVTMLPGMIKG